MCTKEEWKFKRPYDDNYSAIKSGDTLICLLPEPHYMPDCGDTTWYNGCIENMKANAHLISAAPLGYKLAEQVIKTSATWISDGLLEIGEGDYILLKKLALEFKAKAEGRDDT